MEVFTELRGINIQRMETGLILKLLIQIIHQVHLSLF